MDYKKSRRLLHILCWSGAILYVATLGLDQKWPLIVFLVMVAAGVIQYAKFGRCPHCGALFNSRARLPKHCPECGKELE